MRTIIRNGRIVDPANQVDRVADLYIDNRKIAAIGNQPASFKADKIIDATNQLVIPGIIDLSARLREPGSEHKATIASETRAAARGGITSVCCPPDTTPVIDTPAVVELVHKRSRQSGKTRVFCLGALTEGLRGETLACMHALKTAGCIGLSNAYIPLKNNAVLRQSLEYAATCDMTVHLYCEDAALKGEGVIHEGLMSARMGLPGIPESAETVAVSTALLLVEQTGARVHFCRLSTANSINQIAAAKQRGLPVTADVAITNLFLTEIDLDGFNSLCHLQPPLRSTRDRDLLRESLANKTIDAICSDHQPHDEDAKSAPFGLTQAGASTIDVFLSLALQLVEEKVINLADMVSLLTKNPGIITGLENGHLSTGAAADICIIDPNHCWNVSTRTLNSSGKNCPFLGWEMSGQVVHTLRDGKIIFTTDS